MTGRASDVGGDVDKTRTALRGIASQIAGTQIAETHVQGSTALGKDVAGAAGEAGDGDESGHRGQ